MPGVRVVGRYSTVFPGSSHLLACGVHCAVAADGGSDDFFQCTPAQCRKWPGEGALCWKPFPGESGKALKQTYWTAAALQAFVDREGHVRETVCHIKYALKLGSWPGTTCEQS